MPGCCGRMPTGAPRRAPGTAGRRTVRWPGAAWRGRVAAAERWGKVMSVLSLAVEDAGPIAVWLLVAPPLVLTVSSGTRVAAGKRERDGPFPFVTSCPCSSVATARRRSGASQAGVLLRQTGQPLRRPLLQVGVQRGVGLEHPHVRPVLVPLVPQRPPGGAQPVHVLVLEP